MAAPQIYIYVTSVKPENVNLLVKSICADVIKRKPSWIIWVGLKSNEKYPNKRHKGETHGQKRKRLYEDRGRGWSDVALNQAHGNQ